MRMLLVILVFVVTIINAEVYRDISGIVVNEEKNLMWQDKDIPNLTAKNGKNYCRNLSLGVFKDWKLPSISQLENMVEIRKVMKHKLKKREDGYYHYLSSNQQKKELRKLKCPYVKTKDQHLIATIDGHKYSFPNAKFHKLKHVERCITAFTFRYLNNNKYGKSEDYFSQNNNVKCVRNITRGGKLKQPLKVKYPNDAGGKINANVEIVYDKETEIIISPNKYKGDRFIENPIFKKNIRIEFQVSKDKKHNENLISFNVETNYDIDKIEIRVNDTFEAIKNKKNKKDKIYRHLAYKTSKIAIDKKIKEITLKLKSSNFIKVYDCNVKDKSCIERQKKDI